MKTSFFSLILILSFSSSGLADEFDNSLDHRIKLFRNYSTNTPTLTTEDVGKVIPTDIPSGSKESDVAKKILDHSLRSMMRALRKSNIAVVQAIHSVSDRLEVNVSFKSLKSNSGKTRFSPKISVFERPQKNEEFVEHNVLTKFNLFQQSALIRYTGFFKAEVSHTLSQNETSVVLSKSLSEDTELGVSQQFGSSNTSSLNFSYNF